MLTVRNYPLYKDDVDKYHSDYYERCRLGSGYFSGACARVAVLLACENVELSEKVFYSTQCYGALLHMINDLGDYLPDNMYNDRSYQDNLSDFKNGRLTLPLFLLLKSTNTEHFDYTENNISESIRPYLIGSKKHIISQYRNLIKGLSFIPSTDQGVLYKLMLSTLKSNKYFKQIME